MNRLLSILCAVALLVGCGSSSSVESFEEWGQLQRDLAAVYEEASPALPEEAFIQFEEAIPPVIALWDEAEVDELRKDIAVNFFNDEGEALEGLRQDAVAQSEATASTLEAALALSSLAPAYFTVVSLKDVLPPDILDKIEEEVGEKLEDLARVIQDLARRAADALGAKASSNGEDVVLDDDPDLADAADEAAHTAQEAANKAKDEGHPAAEDATDRLDEAEQKKKDLATAKKDLRDAFSTYEELFAASKRGERDALGGFKVDMFDLLDAMNAVRDALKAVNECLEKLGMDPLELEDLEDL